MNQETTSILRYETPQDILSALRSGTIRLGTDSVLVTASHRMAEALTDARCAAPVPAGSVIAVGDLLHRLLGEWYDEKAQLAASLDLVGNFENGTATLAPEDLAVLRKNRSNLFLSIEAPNSASRQRTIAPMTKTSRRPSACSGTSTKRPRSRTTSSFTTSTRRRNGRTRNASSAA